MKKVTLFLITFLFNFNLMASSEIINSKRLKLDEAYAHGWGALFCKDKEESWEVILDVDSAYSSRVRRKLLVAQTDGSDIEFQKNISVINSDHTLNCFVVKEKARTPFDTPESREEYKFKKELERKNKELLIKAEEVKRAQDLREREIKLEEDKLRQEQEFKREQLRSTERITTEELRHARELASEKERKEERRKKSQMFNPEAIELTRQKLLCGTVYTLLREEAFGEQVQITKELYKHILSKKKAAQARRSLVAFHWDDFYDYLNSAEKNGERHQILEEIVWAVESSCVEGLPQATVVKE